MVFEKLREIISEQLELSEELITMESNLMEDFDADSLDLVELVMAFEEGFHSDIPDEDAEKLTTVGAAIAYVESKSQE